MPSSVIASFNYNAENEILQIIFVSGKIYNYKKVPEGIYHAMKASFSKGIYFNHHVKNNYSFEIVKR
jgi:hypothetical protein